jgi:outer membrane protein
MQYHLWLMALAANLLVGLPAVAMAQTRQTPAPTIAARDAIAANDDGESWRVMLGVAPIYSPSFQGSKDYQLQIFPDIRVNYGKRFFASIPDGIGYDVIHSNGWRIGPVAKLRFGRDEEDGTSPFRVAGSETNALRGLSDVDATVELGGYIDHRFKQLPLQFRTELRQGVNGHEGVLADVSLRWLHQAGPARISIGPKLSLASRDFMQAYYGVDATQSANSGLAVHNAKGGLLSYGLGTMMIMPVAEGTVITAFGSYDRLGSHVADAPLVDERGSANQFTFGASIGYSFGL